jgi:hypothetical protein
LTPEAEILKTREQAEAAYRAFSPDEFLTFARGLNIPSAHGPRMFADVMQDFQVETFQDLAPSIHAVRDGATPPKRRFWIERTKGAAKDSDLGVCLLWLVAFPTRPTYFQVGAADRDQAAIVKRRIGDLLHYNEWLNEFVKITNYKVRHLGGLAELDILAAEAAGAHGGTPDLLVVNELSHVTKWEFVENLLDNADKVPQGLVVIATNAGFKGTKAHVWRENADGSDGWSVHTWLRPAPWIAEEDVQDAERRNPKSRYRRLWWGQWASGKGDALDEDDIDRCLRARSGPLTAPEPGWRYVAGLDLGVSNDHAGLVILGVDERRRRLRLARMKAWIPGKGGEVILQDVEDDLLAAWRTFNFCYCGYDPYQAKHMAQRLVRKGVPMQELTFTGANCDKMANTLLQVIEAGILEAYDDEEGRLRRDFGKFNLVEKSYGYKLEAVSDEHGHADVGIALVICLPRAMEMLAGAGGLRPDEDVADEGDFDEMSPEEFEKMPPELQDIYSAYDDLAEEDRLERAQREYRRTR